MVKNKLITAIAALGLMATSVGAFAAGSTYEVNTDTPTELKITWTGDITSFASASVDINTRLTYWDIRGVESGNASIFGMTYWSVLVSAQHSSESPAHPHAGDNPLGAVFEAGLAGTYGSSGVALEAAAHNAAVTSPVSVLPMTPHTDNYTLSVASAANNGGVSTMTLTAIHPVPEPETYAMFLAGLGLLGAVARRRKDNA